MKITVLYPGGFKPVHGGHLDLVRRYASMEEVEDIRIIVGPKQRDGIDQQTAFDLAEILFDEESKVMVEWAEHPTPVLTAFKIVDAALYGKYTMAVSNKDRDMDKYRDFVNGYSKTGRYFASLAEDVEVVDLKVDTQPLLYKGRNDDYEGKPISSTVIRTVDVPNRDKEAFATNYPNASWKTINRLWRRIKNVIS